jgi:hypothetical protein
MTRLALIPSHWRPPAAPPRLRRVVMLTAVALLAG